MGPVDEGTAFAAAVQQAKEDGKKPGDKFTVDGKEYTLKKEHLGEVELPTSIQTKANQQVKDAPTMAKAMLDFYNQIQSKEQMDFSKNPVFKLFLPKLQDLASKSKVDESFINEAAGENLELKSLQKKAYSALKKMGFDPEITSGEAGAGKTILSKQTYKSNRGYALVNLDPKTGIFDVLITSNSLQRNEKGDKDTNLDPDQEANKVVVELEKLIDKNKFEVAYKRTTDRGGSIYQIFVRAKSMGRKGGVMATESLSERILKELRG